MQLFYIPELKESSQNFSFEREESKHVVKVLRKKEGDIIYVTNGKGGLFEGKIAIASDRKCVVFIQKFTFYPKRNYSIHIAVAPTKMMDRLEWFVEKATELGIERITPILCEHSERKILKTERLEKIAIAAMKQSNQFYIPVIDELTNYSDFVNTPRDGQLFLAHCEEESKTELKNIAEKLENYTLLIGPEGDFSPKEIELALSNKYQAVALGSTRLRTETAALVGCHTFVLINN